MRDPTFLYVRRLGLIIKLLSDTLVSLDPYICSRPLIRHKNYILAVRHRTSFCAHDRVDRPAMCAARSATNLQVNPAKSPCVDLGSQHFRHLVGSSRLTIQHVSLETSNWRCRFDRVSSLPGFPFRHCKSCKNHSTSAKKQGDMQRSYKS